MSSARAQATSEVQSSKTSTGEPGPRKRRSRVKWILLAVFVAIAGWAAFDRYGPSSSNLREFDPDEVARLETAMWRSYYDKQRLKLFRELAELMRTQYKMSFVRSNAVAYQAARAAFVFKDGRGRADYEKALPNLVSFYSEIRKIGETSFDVDRAARLELEWWIVHRERHSRNPGDLQRALAELPAELYDVPADRLQEHARLRAEAMTIRDDRADQGGVTEADWVRIDQLLHASWRSLWQAVNG